MMIGNVFLVALIAIASIGTEAMTSVVHRKNNRKASPFPLRNVCAAAAKYDDDDDQGHPTCPKITVPVVKKSTQIMISVVGRNKRKASPFPLRNVCDAATKYKHDDQEHPTCPKFTAPVGGKRRPTACVTKRLKPLRVQSLPTAAKNDDDVDDYYYDEEWIVDTPRKKYSQGRAMEQSTVSLHSCKVHHLLDCHSKRARSYVEEDDEDDDDDVILVTRKLTRNAMIRALAVSFEMDNLTSNDGIGDTQVFDYDTSMHDDHILDNITQDFETDHDVRHVVPYFESTAIETCEDVASFE